MKVRWLAPLFLVGWVACKPSGETVDGGPPPINRAARCPDDRTWLEVSAGSFQTCGLHGDGCIECWGGEELDGELNVTDTGERRDWVDYGDDEPPYGAFTHIAVSQDGLGSNHACALDTEGRVSCWGRDDVGQSTPPAGTFAVLSLNSHRTCGIRTDTTIACWGLWSEFGGMPTDPGFVSLHSGASGYTCAVNVDGYVACWQQEERFVDRIGQFSSVGVGYRACASRVGETIDCWRPSDGLAYAVDGVPAEPGFVHVCQSSDLGCALAADGHVECWGYVYDVPADTKFSQVSCGSQHACGVTLDGEIECWGLCGDGGECDVPP